MKFVVVAPPPKPETPEVYKPDKPVSKKVTKKVTKKTTGRKRRIF